VSYVTLRRLSGKCKGTEKAPAIHGRGKLSRAGVSDQFGPSRSAFTGRAEHPLVALPMFWVLFIQKFARQSQGTKTFDLNQNFEPRARNRRPTIDVGGSEDARSIMSDEFDSLDASEKAAIRSTLIRCRVLAAKIANELRNKRPEHFVDKLSLADIHASLERAADVLSRVKQCSRRPRRRR